MKKVICILMTVLMLVSAMSLSAFAADTSVTYKGQAEKFVFVPESTDLFDNFKGVMPGDSLTQRINIVNEESNDCYVKIYMTAEADNETGEEFLKMLSLSFTSKDKLSDLNNETVTDLTKNILIGTFTSGSTADLDVKLDVPVELTNEYMDAVANINFIFTVEEIPVEKDTPGQTGDNLLVIAAVAVAVAVVLTTVVVVRKKKED